MDYKKQGHCVYYTRYHLVIATKHRRKLLKDAFREYLKSMIIAVGSRIPEVEIIEVNTDSDHVHILLSIPPRISISDVVKILKAKTGLSMRNKFPFLDKAEGGFWSRGYCVSTVGVSELTTGKYIQMQGKEDTGPDFS
ncbi:MAG: IS200/IS605 family transposase [Planctomycetota bacterium]|jgi:putative transposase